MRWDVASGALLLFLTNAVTIAFAAALVFFVRGFAPETHIVHRRIPHTLTISAFIIIILLVPLTYYSVQFVQQANENRQINEVVTIETNQIGAELVELQTLRLTDGLDMVITVRTNAPLRYEQVVALQKGIVNGLHLPVSLKVNQIFAERLDPLVPPTATHTPIPTYTITPGPSPTRTYTVIPPSITPTHTSTPTLTPTPALAQALNATPPKLQLYQSPNGPVIGQLRAKQPLIVLYGRQVVNGLAWIEVMDSEGRIGWIPEIYLQIVTVTPTP
jgi:hypothetical protein